jgi:hypothetical protein
VASLTDDSRGVIYHHNMFMGQSSGTTLQRVLLLLQVQGLFKGMMYPMVSAGVLNSLFFGVYGVSLRAMTSLRGHGAEPNYLEIYLAGVNRIKLFTSVIYKCL